VAAAYRGQQIASGLLRAAVDYARLQGAEVVEAYPKDIGTERVADRALYFGTVSMFKLQGFREVARRHPNFPILRLRLQKQTK
jgi:GNAT superfamily N-acetyltransferase